MLHALNLNNFALIDAHELVLDQGFSVITGETGAGKSLILAALSLCLGGRGDSDWIRFGQKSADIYAQFVPTPAAQEWLADAGRDCEDILIIRRQLSEQGRSRAWINGEPASLSELKSLGTHLVQMHTQHAALELLKPAYVVSWLDLVAGLTDKAQQVADAYGTWQHKLALANQADNDAAARLDRQTVLEARLADIEPLLGVNLAEVNARYDELSNIESLAKDACQAAVFLDNDSDEPSVLTLLGRAIKLCESQSDLSAVFGDAYDSLLGAYDAIKDTHSTLLSYGENSELDEEELAHLSGLIAAAHKLSGKYRTPIEELIEKSQSWQDELISLHTMDNPEELKRMADEAFLTYQALSQDLHKKRLAAAPELCKQLVAHLVPLALPNAVCRFEFSEAKPSATGLYDIALLFGTNVGMPLLPLHKVASGGELSRVSLVMQVMCAAAQGNLPLLVFDEVDVGISGGTAQVVGELLRSLGERQQILAITHQAQVAACAHAHLLVRKTHNNQTTSQIVVLDTDERVHELARMAGGVQITDETLAHAKSLLSALH